MIHAQLSPLPFPRPHDLLRNVQAFQMAKPQELLSADRHRVLMLTIQPGDTLPEQFHLYANKMLVIMEGCATVLTDARTKMVYEGQSHSISFGTRHQISNTGKIALRILEIRSGACVEDDDTATA